MQRPQVSGILETGRVSEKCVVFLHLHLCIGAVTIETLRCKRLPATVSFLRNIRNENKHAM